MIKKTLIFFVVVFISWSILLEFYPIVGRPTKAKGNISRAEGFIFDVPDVENLIVGTSLARKLPDNKLNNFYNLSFGGQTVFDGLNILRLKKELPEYVFIEINVLRKKENKEFKELISSPVLNPLKSVFNSLRIDRQPLLLFSDYILVRRSKGSDNTKKKVKEEKTHDAELDDYYEMRMKKRIKQYSEPVKEKSIRKRFKTLSEQVDFLTSKGVKVVFFEMPINPRLTNLKWPTCVRERVLKDFPDYDFIAIPEDADTYKTLDGIHLSSEEAKRYSRYLSDEADKIFKKYDTLEQ